MRKWPFLGVVLKNVAWSATLKTVKLHVWETSAIDAYRQVSSKISVSGRVL